MACLSLFNGNIVLRLSLLHKICYSYFYNVPGKLVQRESFHFVILFLKGLVFDSGGQEFLQQHLFHSLCIRIIISSKIICFSAIYEEQACGDFFCCHMLVVMSGNVMQLYTTIPASWWGHHTGKWPTPWWCSMSTAHEMG